MSANQLYDIWFRRIGRLLPHERITRVRNLVWIIVGMYLSRSVHLSKIAIKVPLGRVRRSTVPRFSRFLRNACFRVRHWYRPVAQHLLAQAAAHGLVRLIIDSTKVGSRHQLLMVGLAYHKRACPRVRAGGPCPLPGPGSGANGDTVVPTSSGLC
jgi:hypothetical protein